MPRRPPTVAAAILAATLAIAACGGSSSPQKKNSSDKLKTSGNAPLRLAECMRTHGVPGFPDPSSSGSIGIDASPGGNGGSISINGHQLNVSAPAFQKAMNECQKFQPHGPPISGSQLAKIKQGALKMAQCMRAHGVPNFSDPVVSSGPGGTGIAVKIGAPGGNGPDERNSPAFAKAQRICMPLMRVGLKAQKAGS
jgi:hypothetical protein